MPKYFAPILFLSLAAAHFLFSPNLFTSAVSLYEITDYEQEILDEFRDMTKDLVYKEFMKSDAYLLRWLTVADFDLYEALESFRKSLAWRKEKDVDSALGENYTFIDEAYPIVLDGKDKDGRPLVYAHVGAFDIRKIAISGDEAMYQRYAIRLFELFEEYMHYLRETTGHHNLTQATCVYDLSGFNLKTGGCFQCLKMLPEMISTYEPNYPDIYYRVYLINTPAVFYNVIRISENFISERSKRAMQVFDFDKAKWTEALLKQIPAEYLPVQYGGLKVAKLDKSSFLKNRDLVRIIQEATEKRNQLTTTTTTEEYYTDQEVGAPFVEDFSEEHQDLEPANSSTTTSSTTATKAPKPKHQHHHHHHVKKFIGAKDPEQEHGQEMNDKESRGSKHQFYQQSQPEAGYIEAIPVSASSRIRFDLPKLIQLGIYGIIYFFANILIQSVVK